MKLKFIWIWKHSLKPTLETLAGMGILIGVAGAVVGSMFGIAYIADIYGIWWTLLYIPWFIGLVTLTEILSEDYEKNKNAS